MSKKPARPTGKASSPSPSQKVAARSQSSTGKSDMPGKWPLSLIAVLVVTLITYAQVFGFSYLNWDDNVNITENINVIQFSLSRIGAIFSLETGTVIGNYNPLSILSLGLEKMLFGEMKPAVTHGINLLLHLGCVLLVFRLFKSLGFGQAGATLGALLFGIHPMRIESVAWATERKDVLFGLFFLLAIQAYLRYLEGKQMKHYAWMVIFALLSVLSKVQAVALPLALLAIDYWLKRPLSVKTILEKWPLWILSLAFGLLNLYTLSEAGSLGNKMANSGLFYKIGIACYGLVVYLYKFLVPYPMSPVYPFPKELPAIAYAAPVLLLGIAALLWMRRRQAWARVSIFGSLFFLVNVMFVLQVVNAGQGFLADRFTYIGYLGLFAILAWLADQWAAKASTQNRSRILTYGLGGAFMLISVLHLPVWKDSLALWNHSINGPGASIPLPYVNRGMYQRDRGAYDQSIQDFNRAIEIDAKESQTYLALGKTYFDQGAQTEEPIEGMIRQSIAGYNKGLALPELNPDDKVPLLVNRGVSYAILKQNTEALADFAAAEQINPKYPETYLNRSLLYLRQADYAHALEDYNKLVDLGAANANIYYERGLCYTNLKDYAAAIRDYSSALQMDAKFAAPYLERARCHALTGNQAQAQRDFQDGLKYGANPSPELRKLVGL